MGITAQRPAAAAADQPSFRGLTPFGLAPLRSAAKRGINSPIGCLLGGSGSGPKESKKVDFVSRRDGNVVGSAVVDLDEECLICTQL